jgi:hypothetical protein
MIESTWNAQKNERFYVISTNLLGKQTQTAKTGVVFSFTTKKSEKSRGRTQGEHKENTCTENQDQFPSFHCGNGDGFTIFKLDFSFHSFTLGCILHDSCWSNFETENLSPKYFFSVFVE